MDDAALLACFRETPATVRTTWRSRERDVVVVTCQHNSEAPGGPREEELPSAGHAAGVVAGHFLGAVNPALPGDTSRRVLQDYAEHGIGCFRNINGSWVAVLWDRQRQSLLLARDTVGTRPLYVARLADRIVFATDLRVFRLAGHDGILDEQAAAEFLHYLYVPPPRTILANCSAVLAGHVLSVGREMEQVRYAGPRFVHVPSLAAADHVHEMEGQLPLFEERLLQAVSDCVPPRGRIALSLSGGKDSSSLAVALAKVCPERVLAFTLGIPGEPRTEADDAAMVCRALGLAHVCYSPRPEDIAAHLPRFLSEHDQPIGDPAAFTYYYGMSQLPPDCTVVMDGAGNDDYFGLTGRAMALRYRTRLELQSRMPGWAWSLLVRAMTLGPYRTRSLGRYWTKPIEESFVSWEGWTPESLSQLQGRPVSFDGTHLWHLMHSIPPDDWKLLLTEVMGRIWEPQSAFAKGTHFAQALGLAIRYPFVDTRLEEYVHTIPTDLKADKAMLRAFLRRYLPREIVEKPKRSFLFDLNRLLANPAYPWPERLARNGAFDIVPSWSGAPVQRLLRNYAARPHEERWQQQLYTLCLLAEWVARAGPASARMAEPAAAPRSDRTLSAI